MTTTKKKLSKAEVKKLLPGIKEFNKLSGAFIGLLKQKETRTKEQLSTIRVMVAGLKIPVNLNQSNISIQTIDMHNTKVTERGKGSSKKKMDWEKEFRNRNKGFMI